ISKRDWSSDVCSSDLSLLQYVSSGYLDMCFGDMLQKKQLFDGYQKKPKTALSEHFYDQSPVHQNNQKIHHRFSLLQHDALHPVKIGRASCRELVTELT